MSFVPGNAKMLPQYSLVSLNLSKISNRYVVGKSYFYNAFLLRMQWHGISPPPPLAPFPPPNSLLLLFEMGCWEERSDLHGTSSTWSRVCLNILICSLLSCFFFQSAQMNAFKASCWFKTENISNTTLQFVVCARHLNEFTDQNSHKCFFFSPQGTGLELRPYLLLKEWPATF